MPSRKFTKYTFETQKILRNRKNRYCSITKRKTFVDVSWRLALQVSVNHRWISTYYKVTESGNYEFFNYTVLFLDTLAQHYNFKVAYNPIDIITCKSLNKTFLPEFGHSLSLLTSNNQNYRFTVTKTFNDYSFGIIITHVVLYTPLEKLFLPVDFAT